MTGWLDGWDRVPGNDSGTWADGTTAPKLLLHTTEGGSIDGAVGAYRANNSWPHVTVDPARRRRVQHVPLDRPARALRNTSTPGQTNRSPTVIQVEIVGKAAETPGWDDECDWLGTDVVGPLCRAAGIPIRTTVTFHGLDAGFTLASTTARQRLTRAQWDSYRGILGHQHAPENTHWDPGGIDIARIIAAANRTTPTGPSTTGDDDMTDADRKLLTDTLAEAKAAGLRAAHCEQLLAQVLAHLNDPSTDGKRPYPVRAIEALARIEAKLGSNPAP